jgi:hypothetical protein
MLQEAHECISDLGEVLVSLLYNENLHRLSVTVIEARRLKVRHRRYTAQGLRDIIYSVKKLNMLWRCRSRSVVLLPVLWGCHLLCRCDTIKAA